MSSSALPTRVAYDFGDQLAGLQAPLAFGVAADGELLVAGRAGEAALYDENPTGARFPKSMLDEPHDWTILRVRPGQPARRIEVRGERGSFSFVQPIGDDVLLVAARCYWRPDGAERNAVVVDPTGRVLRRFTLGDGIQDVRTTENAIWVSYFDEGVFGNYGWGRPGPPPIGTEGIVWFDLRGERQGAYDAGAAGSDARSDRVESRFHRVERRPDRVERRSDRLESRFPEVEWRSDRVESRFLEVERRSDRVESRFHEVERPSDRVKPRFRQVKRRSDRVESRFHQVERRSDWVESRFHEVELRSDRVES